MSVAVREDPGGGPVSAGTHVLASLGARRLRATRGAKAVLDAGLAAVLLLILLPLGLLIALCIVVESPGPVFYRAARLGRHGHPLRMLKFRKMAPHAGGLALTLAADPRLTRVGRVLAATKLDELPQLWHVVRGDMSLVGPRPEDPAFVARYPEQFAEILAVRPGITGLSQLAFACESDVLPEEDAVAGYIGSILPQKLGMDQLYVSRWSLGLDLRILFWTLAAIVLRRPVAVDRETGHLGVRRRLRPRRRPAAEAPRAPLEIEPRGQEAT